MYTKQDFEKMDYEVLKKLLVNASDSYYNKSVSFIFDEEFDTGLMVFRKKYPDDEFLKQIGAPIVTTEWEKAEHHIPMTSLNKVNEITEFIKWTNTIGDSRYILEEKLDGISVNLEFTNGKLVKAITRGDSHIGENIFNNVIKMQNVKRTIPNFTGSIRGEIVMFTSDFKKMNEVLRSNDNKEMKNLRNAASGIAKRFDGTDSNYLTVLYYDVTLDFKTEEEKMIWLERQGLKTCFYKKCTPDECVVIYNEYENSKRAKCEWDIDGIVIKANSIELQKRLGELNGNPKGQIAWKFSAMKAETVIEGIEWSRGNNMRITPVALLKPVKLGGVIIQRASLHNLEIFNSFDLGKGDIVLIKRSGDVIPQIVEVVKHVGNIKLKPPLSCPICGEELTQDDKNLLCPNTCCGGVILGNLNKWVEALEIKDVSDKTIELLNKVGMVNDPADFYTLKEEEIAKLERMGNRSASIIVNHFNEKKEIDLKTFIDGLNVPNFSGSRAEILIKAGIDTLDKMISAKEEELMTIKGIGKEVATSIIYGLSAKKNIIGKLLKVIKIKETIQKEAIVAKSKVLVDKVFVFTGKVERVDDEGERWTRERLQDLVYENGGTCVDSVTKEATTLVQANVDSVSSKSQKAKKMGIEIVSEKDFFKSLGM